MDNISIFISGYSNENLKISKEKGILGWLQRKKELKIGDYVFIYNIDEKRIESVFKISSANENINTVWQDEETTGLIKYKNRWNADLTKDNLDISFNDIVEFNPFNGDIRRFNLIIRNPFPTLLDDKFSEVRNFLLEKAGFKRLIEKKEVQIKIDNSKDENEITFESLVDSTLFPVEKIKEINNLLEKKKQIIFYGPPGTSKTFFAKKFAQFFTKTIKNIQIIQFHPSYSYEDFIEGIKPNLLDQGGKVEGFIKKEGIFKTFSKKAKDNPNEKFVLIIDEINRGNISKIFGELIYLLEYRDEAISLTYSVDSNDKFSIPLNLYIIGTMNSADRSIAFVDYALRRRFYFIDFYPDLDIFAKWIEKIQTRSDTGRLALNMLKEINQKISSTLGKDYTIGYSYLMITSLNYYRLNEIVKYAILPLVEQYYLGKKEQIKEISDICNSVLENVKNSDLSNKI
jgi:5-methylcytosine-specific restriction endonuclease McrBC GTP-binding regulatory subunit McrB